MELEHINSSDNHTIVFCFNRAKTLRADSICILLHGMFANKKENGRFEILSNLLNEAGFDTLCFDFRGHGDSNFSSRKFTISGALNDLTTVISSVHSQSYGHINLIASSFFASIALLYSARPLSRSINKIALLNPVIDFDKNILRSKSPSILSIINGDILDKIDKCGEAKLANGFVVSAELLRELRTIKPYSFIRNIDAPLAVYHGTCDETVDFQVIKEYFSNKKNCDLKIIEGGTHAFKDPVQQQYVFQHLVNWLSDEKKGTL